MSQTSDKPEETKPAETAQAAPAVPAAETGSNVPSEPAKTGNLADTDPEYKHKHGEHKDGEHHHHHHHHHHHRHRHFHIFNLSVSGIRDNLKLMFKSIFSYPYILLFLSLVFLLIMNSGIILSQLNAHKGSFTDVETFYRWQEYLVMHKALLIRIPFQFTLLVSVGITLFLMQQGERHWQRNVMKILPALGAALLFSIPMGGGRPAEDFARSACRDCLRNYHVICIEYADLNDGAFPAELPEKPAPAAKYGADHYVYHGRGKKASDEPFVLLEDKDESHIGNYRYAIRNDGVLLVSKYGDMYEEYKGKKPAGNQ